MKNMKKAVLVSASAVVLASAIAVVPVMQNNQSPFNEEIGASQSVQTTPKSMVTTDNLNLRSLASEKGDILLTIPKGASLTTDTQIGSWFKVTYEGKTGYVSSDFLQETASKVQAVKTFPDVKAFKGEISYLTGKGIIMGYPDGTFKPNANIKRIDAIRMIMRELAVKDMSAPNPKFLDMTPKSPGYKEFAKAVQLGIISGKVKPNGKSYFDPNGTLTRAEMAKILSDAYNLKENKQISFKDVGSKHWAKDYISRLATAGVTTGHSDGSFKPSNSLSREHFSAFMARLLNPDEYAVTVPTPKPEPTPTPKPEPTPAPSKGLMPRAEAVKVLDKHFDKQNSTTFALVSGSGRDSILIGLESSSTAKANISLDIRDYSSSAWIKPEDFGQDVYNETQAYLKQMKAGTVAFFETQFGAGSSDATKLATELQNLALNGKDGDVKKISVQGKTVTMKNDGMYVMASY